MKRDNLKRHWRHPVIVCRLIGSGARGDVFGQTEMHYGAVDATTKMVRNAEGVEVVSSASVAFPSTVAFIPAGSEITLPSTHGGRTSRVIECQVADGGGMSTPDHIAVRIE